MSVEKSRQMVASLAKTYVALARTLRDYCRQVGLDPEVYAGPSQVTALFIEARRCGLLLPPSTQLKPEEPDQR